MAALRPNFGHSQGLLLVRKAAIASGETNGPRWGRGRLKKPSLPCAATGSTALLVIKSLCEELHRA